MATRGGRKGGSRTLQVDSSGQSGQQNAGLPRQRPHQRCDAETTPSSSALLECSGPRTTTTAAMDGQKPPVEGAPLDQAALLQVIAKGTDAQTQTMCSVQVMVETMKPLIENLQEERHEQRAMTAQLITESQQKRADQQQTRAVQKKLLEALQVGPRGRGPRGSVWLSAAALVALQSRFNSFLAIC